MELKFKRLSENAILPIRAHKGDAGLDLTATRITTELNECGQLILVYHTDLAVEIPEGYMGLMFPRSGIYKKSLMQTNCVGVIDAGYRGEVMAKFRNTTDVVPAVYREGERFAQLVIVPIPDVTVVEAAELSETDRGENGMGSTGVGTLNSSAATGSAREEENPGDEADRKIASGEAANGLEVAE